MSTFPSRLVRYATTRNPMTLAELCVLPASPGEWLHWATWLLIAALE